MESWEKGKALVVKLECLVIKTDLKFVTIAVQSKYLLTN